MNAIWNVSPFCLASNIKCHTWQLLLRRKRKRKRKAPEGWRPQTQQQGRSHSFPAAPSHKSQRSVNINKEQLIVYQAAGSFVSAMSLWQKGRRQHPDRLTDWQTVQTFSNESASHCFFYVNNIWVTVNDDQTPSGLRRGSARPPTTDTSGSRFRSKVPAAPSRGLCTASCYDGSHNRRQRKNSCHRVLYLPCSVNRTRWISHRHH